MQCWFDSLPMEDRESKKWGDSMYSMFGDSVYSMFIFCFNLLSSLTIKTTRYLSCFVPCELGFKLMLVRWGQRCFGKLVGSEPPLVWHLGSYKSKVVSWVWEDVYGFQFCSCMQMLSVCMLLFCSMDGRIYEIMYQSNSHLMQLSYCLPIAGSWRCLIENHEVL